DATRGRGKLTVSSGGLSSGADVKLSETLTVGVGGGYGGERAKVGKDQGRVDSNSWMGAVYGSVAPADGLFVPPTLVRLDRIEDLDREWFGPILHVYRYEPKDLEKVAGKLAARGFGLTLGVHSRIDAFAKEVMELVPAGNVYVNRSIIGAVVGVQPFGGEGLSGTGPKAGGPNSLIRYAAEKAISINIAAQGGDPALLNL
ncbi:hypothetical protein LTR94_027582, partial [Friedmanniomyces endolithicus]